MPLDNKNQMYFPLCAQVSRNFARLNHSVIFRALALAAKSKNQGSRSWGPRATSGLEARSLSLSFDAGSRSLDLVLLPDLGLANVLTATRLNREGSAVALSRRRSAVASGDVRPEEVAGVLRAEVVRSMSAVARETTRRR